MKKIPKTKTYYRCEVCKTDYERKRDALACEKSGVEEQKFHVGDKVFAREGRQCVQGHKYVCGGKIVRVVGPEPYSEEVHGKGFGLWGVRGHIYMYELTACCYVCADKDETSVRYPAAALRRCILCAAPKRTIRPR
jgi:hypothetical protein